MDDSIWVWEIFWSGSVKDVWVFKENINKVYGWWKMEKGKFIRWEIGGLGFLGEWSDVVRFF